MAWTAPRTWTALEIPTASMFNTDHRDNLRAIGDPWTPFTPTWTASGTQPVIGDGTIVGAYSAAGKRVSFWAIVTMGASTTYGTGAYFLSLPILQNLTPNWVFNGIAFDTSAGTSYPTYGQNLSSSLIRIMKISGTQSLASVSNTVPFTWAAGDTLSINGSYEAA